MAIAQNTLILAVGDQAKLVPQVLAGRAEGIPPRQYDVHFGPRAEGADYTVTVSRFFRSNPSIITSPIRALILVTRAAWLQVWQREGGEVTLDGALMTGGRFARFRLELQWKLATKAIALMDRDARVVLRSLKARPIKNGLRLRMNGGPEESAAMKRLTARFLRRLGLRRGGRRGSAASSEAAPEPHTAPPPAQ